MGGAENEEVGSRDLSDVIGLELVRVSNAGGRVGIDAHLPELTLLDVLGAVAEHLVSGDRELVRSDPGKGAVDPQPAAPTEVDQQGADLL
jgi:hypothetical protein